VGRSTAGARRSVLWRERCSPCRWRWPSVRTGAISRSMSALTRSRQADLQDARRLRPARAQGPKVRRLTAGGRWIRTPGSARDEIISPYWRAFVSLGLTREYTADLICERAYFVGCEVHTWIFDDAKPQCHGLPQCNTIADPSRRNRDAGAGKIGGDVFGEPRTRRRSVEDDKWLPLLAGRNLERFRRRPQTERRWLTRTHHEPRRAHRDPRLRLGVRRGVD